MDANFHNISVGLYRRDDACGVPQYRVFTYSQLRGAASRINFIVRAMKILGGLIEVSDVADAVRFECGSAHLLACRRVFLEACKLKPDVPIEVPAMSIVDRKVETIIRVTRSSVGLYHLESPINDDRVQARLSEVAVGYQKLSDMRAVEGSQKSVGFDCGFSHDPLVGLLLSRALNARASLREQELMAKRGVLVAPSAQT
jgi:hypothetical protein